MLTAEMPSRPEVLPMHNTRRQNRETFTRLFQGFVSEYGEDAAKRIIKHLVDQAGGLRMWIPSSGPDPLSRCGYFFRLLWRETCKTFGRQSGRAIMNKIMVELGGRRVYFPDYRDLYIWDRNEKIRRQYIPGMPDGPKGNEEELVARWGLSRYWILRIANGQDD